MKVLLIGGTGNISGAVAARALREGDELWLFNRGNRSVPEGARLIRGDIRDEAAAAILLAEHTFDAVADFVAFRPEDVQEDIRLFSGKTGQFLFISSASAYQKPPVSYLVTESTPLSNPYYRYPQDKTACEEVLTRAYRENGFPVTVVRPSYTYDKSIPYLFNSHSAPWTLIDRIRRGKPVILPGDGGTLWTLTHASDFARGFCGLFGNPQAIGQAYHITSDEVLSWEQILAAIGKASGAQPKVKHIPVDFLDLFAPDRAASLRGDKLNSLVFDNTKIKRAVPGFAAEIPFHRGIADAVAWFDAHPAECTVDEAFNTLCDRIIDAYEKSFAYARELAKQS